MKLVLIATLLATCALSYQGAERPERAERAREIADRARERADRDRERAERAREFADRDRDFADRDRNRGDLEREVAGESGAAVAQTFRSAGPPDFPIRCFVRPLENRRDLQTGMSARHIELFEVLRRLTMTGTC